VSGMPGTDGVSRRAGARARHAGASRAQRGASRRCRYPGGAAYSSSVTWAPQRT
jgi:hypothetical protein